MLDNITETVTDIASEAAKATVRHAPRFLPSMDNVRNGVRWGMSDGIHDLTRIGMVAGGVAFVGGATYGIVKSSKFLTRKSRNAASSVRQRFSSSEKKGEGAEVEVEAEIIPPNNPRNSKPWRAKHAA